MISSSDFFNKSLFEKEEDAPDEEIGPWKKVRV